MNEVEIAWVAGLLEGEGSFSIAKRGVTAAGRPKPNRQVHVTCGMTDRDVVERLLRTVGVGSIFLDTRSRTNPKHKDLYTWRTAKRADVEALLRTIRPYMGLRRGAKIDEILAYFESHPPIYKRPVACGTRQGYRKGCRCDPCRDANRAYGREIHQRRKQRAAISQVENSAA